MDSTHTTTDAEITEPLMRTLRPSGHVLEVGFDTGSYARAIEEYHPASHTIIEPDASRAEQARLWGKSYPHVTVIETNWEQALPLLKQFDAILFHEHILSSTSDPYHKLSHLALEKGKEVLSMVKAIFPEITNIHYSDHDLDSFYEQVGQFHLKDLSYFFYELHTQGQISREQYERAAQKYSLKKECEPNPLFSSRCASDPLFDVVQICLERHMHPGSRFCCRCSQPVSKYEHAQFFDHIITNSDLNYEELLLSTDPAVLIFSVERCV